MEACARRAIRSARASTSWPRGVPPGLGEPVFDRLDADIAHAMMGINAVKAVEIGAGLPCGGAARQRAPRRTDARRFPGNHAGGVLGGISSGQDIVVHMALKPTSSIRLPGRTIDVAGEAAEIVTTGRHDPCVGHPRHADRRGHAGDRADGPLPAQPGAERRRPLRDAGHHAPQGSVSFSSSFSSSIEHDQEVECSRAGCHGPGGRDDSPACSRSASSR